MNGVTNSHSVAILRPAGVSRLAVRREDLCRSSPTQRMMLLETATRLARVSRLANPGARTDEPENGRCK
jgi:hypothetical protein